MATTELIMEVRIRWWLRLFIRAVVLLHDVFGFRPSERTFMFCVERGLKIGVAKSA